MRIAYTRRPGGEPMCADSGGGGGGGKGLQGCDTGDLETLGGILRAVPLGEKVPGPSRSDVSTFQYHE